MVLDDSQIYFTFMYWTILVSILPFPQLIFWQIYTDTHIYMVLKKRKNMRKHIGTCGLQNVGHFVQAQMG